MASLELIQEKYNKENIHFKKTFDDVPRYANNDYNEYDDDYKQWIGEDHPLRSYPTACCPGLWQSVKALKFGQAF